MEEQPLRPERVSPRAALVVLVALSLFWVTYRWWSPSDDVTLSRLLRDRPPSKADVKALFPNPDDFASQLALTVPLPLEATGNAIAQGMAETGRDLANAVWQLEADETIQYEPGFNVPEREFEEFLRLKHTFRLKDQEKFRLRAHARSADSVALDADPEFPALSGVEIDAASMTVTTPFGVCTAVRRQQRASGDSLVAGVSALCWSSDAVQATSGLALPVQIKFVLAKRSTSNDAILSLNVTTVVSGTPVSLADVLVGYHVANGTSDSGIHLVGEGNAVASGLSPAAPPDRRPRRVEMPSMPILEMVTSTAVTKSW